MPKKPAGEEKGRRLRVSLGMEKKLLAQKPSLGRTSEAIPLHEKAVRPEPDNAVLHLIFGIRLLKIPGRAGEAITELSEATRPRPDDERVRWLVSQIRACAAHSWLRRSPGSKPSARSRSRGSAISRPKERPNTSRSNSEPVESDLSLTSLTSARQRRV
jgi:hypothetical protein